MNSSRARTKACRRRNKSYSEIKFCSSHSPTIIPDIIILEEEMINLRYLLLSYYECSEMITRLNTLTALCVCNYPRAGKSSALYTPESSSSPRVGAPSEIALVGDVSGELVPPTAPGPQGILLSCN